MEKEIPYDLLARYFAGECSEEEINRVEKWRNEDPSNKKAFDDFSAIWNISDNRSFNPDLKKALSAVNDKIDREENKTKQRGPDYFLIRIAAVLILGLLSWILIQTLGDKNIHFNSGKEIVSITLSDGSQITLNKNSTLVYPEIFNRKSRKIRLSGEAYFEVTKDPNRPFVIEAEGSFTKVLGTSFNIKAIEGENEIVLTVDEGKVSFSGKKKNESIVLKTGEKGTLNKELLKINKETFLDDNDLSWKNKELNFKDVSLKNVLSAMETLYKIEIKTSNQSLDSITVVLDIPAGTSAEDALNALSYITGTVLIKADTGYVLTK